MMQESQAAVAARVEAGDQEAYRAHVERHRRAARAMA